MGGDGRTLCNTGSSLMESVDNGFSLFVDVTFHISVGDLVQYKHFSRTIKRFLAFI